MENGRRQNQTDAANRARESDDGDEHHLGEGRLKMEPAPNVSLWLAVECGRLHQNAPGAESQHQLPCVARIEQVP